MIRNGLELMQSLQRCILEHGLGQNDRVIVREGATGPERTIEHIKIRSGPLGLELIIEIKERPLDA